MEFTSLFLQALFCNESYFEWRFLYPDEDETLVFYCKYHLKIIKFLNADGNTNSRFARTCTSVQPVLIKIQWFIK